MNTVNIPELQIEYVGDDITFFSISIMQQRTHPGFGLLFFSYFFLLPRNQLIPGRQLGAREVKEQPVCLR